MYSQSARFQLYLAAVLAGLVLILVLVLIGIGVGIGVVVIVGVGIGIGVVLVIHDWHLLYLCKGSMSRKNTPYSQKISKKLVDIAELV